jgi:putative membrane protein
MSLYPFIVAAHVTSVVFFIGGMLMQTQMVLALSRLSTAEQTGPLMALHRLERHVVTPAMTLTWTFGVALATWLNWFSSPWLIIKLIVVVALSGLHGIQSGRLRRSLAGGGVQPLKGASIAIVLGMLTIATLAFVKPF